MKQGTNIERRPAVDAVDHLVYATPYLEASARVISESLGIGLVEGGPHLGRGTRNYLLGLGGKRYLEVIGPDREQDGPADVWPFGLDLLTEGKLVNWATAVEDLEAVVRSAREAGYDPGNILELSRRTPSGELLCWRVSKLPKERLPFDGIVPFLVEWSDTPHPTSSLVPQVDLIELSAKHPDPQGAKMALQALGLQMPVGYGFPALSARITTPGGTIELQ